MGARPRQDDQASTEAPATALGRRTKPQLDMATTLVDRMVSIHARTIRRVRLIGSVWRHLPLHLDLPVEHRFLDDQIARDSRDALAFDGLAGEKKGLD